MGNIFKRILTGLGIGFLFGGPLGAILGAVVAGGLPGVETVFGAGESEKERFLFYSHLVILMTLVAKADGRITGDETAKILATLRRELDFSEQDLEIAERLIAETERQNPSPEAIAAQYSRTAAPEVRLALLRLLWIVACADGHIDRREEQFIAGVGAAMRLSAADQRAVRAEFFSSSDQNYRLLGVDPEATDEEVREAYRRMAKQSHPDRVAHLGEEYARLAGEKFSQINAAYDGIRSERGL